MEESVLSEHKITLTAKILSLLGMNKKGLASYEIIRELGIDSTNRGGVDTNIYRLANRGKIEQICGKWYIIT